MNSQEVYLGAIPATVIRQTLSTDRILLSPDKILKVVGRDSGERHFLAFNLCGGTRSQSDLAREAGLDSSNFRKSPGRWIDADIAIRAGENRESPLDAYPLPRSHVKKAAMQ